MKKVTKLKLGNMTTLSRSEMKMIMGRKGGICPTDCGDKYCVAPTCVCMVWENYTCKETGK